MAPRVWEGCRRVLLFLVLSKSESRKSQNEENWLRKGLVSPMPLKLLKLFCLLCILSLLFLEVVLKEGMFP